MVPTTMVKKIVEYNSYHDYDTTIACYEHDFTGDMICDYALFTSSSTVMNQFGFNNDLGVSRDDTNSLFKYCKDHGLSRKNTIMLDLDNLSRYVGDGDERGVYGSKCDKTNEYIFMGYISRLTLSLMKMIQLIMDMSSDGIEKDDDDIKDINTTLISRVSTSGSTSPPA